MMEVCLNSPLDLSVFYAFYKLRVKAGGSRNDFLSAHIAMAS